MEEHDKANLVDLDKSSDKNLALFEVLQHFLKIPLSFNFHKGYYDVHITFFSIGRSPPTTFRSNCHQPPGQL